MDNQFISEKIKTFIANKKNILILGFGREGHATYKIFRTLFPNLKLTIADANKKLNIELNKISDNNLQLILGDNYLSTINDYDLIIKTPGISLKDINLTPNITISSQTDIFLQLFHQQIIGVTGTKGKSTTVSLIYHILKLATNNVILVGNIGIPMFDLLEQINQDTIIVAELSSHQLEYIKISPRIAVLLNLYQEHLDHYKSFKDYKNAKLNITRYQTETDYFIYNNDDISIKALLGKNVYKRNYYQYSLSNIDIEQGTFLKDHVIFAVKDGNNIDYSYDTHNKRNLIGEHNLYNIMAAINVCRILNIQNDFITNGINSFKGLEHRIEYVGDFDGVSYYNDSISTIPEATIQAVNALKSVNTILLGGFDRGIDYNQLIDFIIKSNIENIIFISSAGHRMLDIYKNTINNSKNNNNKTRQNIYFTNNFEDAVRHAQKLTKKGEICLLSPAAASYDMFHNFEERGNYFKQLIKKT